MPGPPRRHVKEGSAAGGTGPERGAVFSIRVVVFDCDGVMFDTTRANTAFYNQILDHLGRPAMADDQVRYMQMHTVFESLSHLLDNDPVLLESASAFKAQMDYAPFLELMEIEPDLIPLLRRLKPDRAVAIVTNRTDTMPELLKTFGLEGYFDLVVTALDVERPKPDPQPLNRVLTHFGCGANEALYIGDSLVDEVAAREAGIPFAAYGNRGLSAAFHIDALREVDEILS